MYIGHIYKNERNGLWKFSKKDPFSELFIVEERIPTFGEILDPALTCIVLKFSSILKEKFSYKKIKLLIIALLTFTSFKYYKIKAPFILDNIFNKTFGKRIFIVEPGGSEVVKYHHSTSLDTFITGTEFVNLVSKENIFFLYLRGRCQRIKTVKNIFVVGLLSKTFLDYLLFKFPDSKLEIRYYDIFHNSQKAKIERVLREGNRQRIKISTYHKASSEKFGIPYEINKVSRRKIQLLEFRKKHSYDFCFVGNASDSRLEVLKILLASFRRLKFRVHLQIPNSQDEYIEDYKVHREKISYGGYLNVLCGSKATIDLWRLDESEGYSYRVSESMALGIKLITNRTIITDEAFYDPSRILLLNDLLIDRNYSLLDKKIKSFMDIPFKRCDIDEFLLE